MAKEFELTEDMMAQIGKETPTWTYEVTTTSVRAFARGLGMTDPVYYDQEIAKNAGYRNLPAPPTYLGTPVFIPGKCSEIFGEPIQNSVGVKTGLRRGLDGSTEIEYFDTICAGDNLTAFNRLADLQVKESKSLGKMLFMTFENIFQNQEKKVVAIRRATLIFY